MLTVLNLVLTEKYARARNMYRLSYAQKCAGKLYGYL